MITMNVIHPGEVAFYVRAMRKEEAARKSHFRLANQTV